MTSPRERILASIRDGLLRAHLPADADGPPWHAAGKTAAPTVQDMAGEFSAALTALSGHVHRASGAAAVADVIAGIARAHQAPSYISWDDEHLGCAGLLGVLSSRGLARVTYDVSGEPGQRALDVDALAGVGLGLTGAHAALAETGGLVLVSGPGRGRLASLLPPVHVTIARTGNVHQSLQHLFDAQSSLADQGSNLVAISGPSRTADIEMTLTRGVHGPGEVHVILLGA